MLKVVEKRDERKAGEELLVLDEIAREGAGSRTKGLLMAFKLFEMAPAALAAAGWRRFTAIGPCRCEVYRWSSGTSSN